MRLHIGSMILLYGCHLYNTAGHLLADLKRKRVVSNGPVHRDREDGQTLRQTQGQRRRCLTNFAHFPSLTEAVVCTFYPAYWTAVFTRKGGGHHTCCFSYSECKPLTEYRGWPEKCTK